jgi:hypothetical protein
LIHAPLHLYEEIALLSLRDQKGTFLTERIDFLVSGAVLAELILDGFMTIAESGKKLCELKASPKINDTVLNECVREIHASTRQRSLKDWIKRLSRIKQLRHKVAIQVCKRKILRADEKTILLIFASKVYPEVNPEPETQILERLQSAIFSSDTDIDPRTAVLIALANACNLLDKPFGKRELRKAKTRIKNITNGSLVGQATQDVIAACEAAALAAIIIIAAT